MCEPMTLAMAAMALGGGAMAFGQYRQGQIEKQVANNNAIMADRAAVDTVKRGEEDAQRVQRQSAALKSTQQVGMAAHGLDIGYGTAQDIQDQTDFFGQSDATTTRQNAFNSAWNQREGAKQLRASGTLAAQQANLQATGTLLSTAGSVASKWYSPSSVGFAGGQSAAPISDRSIR